MENLFCEPKFILGKTLGSGGYGTVYHAIDSETDERVVVKVLSGSDLSHYREMEIMSLCSRKAPELFPKPRGYFFEFNQPCIAMERFDCNAGSKKVLNDIKKWAETAGTIWSPQLKKIFCDLLKAVDFLHSQNIYHRDISTSNILYSRKENRMVLGDLGISKRFMFIPNEKTPATGVITSLWFRAPEAFEEDGAYTGAVDMWSLGIVFIYFLTGKVLTRDNIIQAVEKLALEWLSDCPEEAKELVLQMVKLDPEKRAGARDLLAKFFGLDNLSREPIPEFEKGLFYTPYIDSTIYNFKSLDYTPPLSKMLPENRRILTFWLLDVGRAYSLNTSSIFATFVALDNYTNLRETRETKLQMIGCACMYLCSSYYELYPPLIEDFVHVAADSFTVEKLVKTVRGIFKTLRPSFFSCLGFHDAVRFACIGRENRISEICDYLLLKNVTDPEYFYRPITESIRIALDDSNAQEIIKMAESISSSYLKTMKKKYG